ncbi:Ctr copper transporter [Lentinula guzmanii]|uniref:Copper transport protein n=4 Tax=Lentinula TaxID=5352 RepID=A0AA38JXE5_9AGAR|nr:Ctr copper transporter [Lentinula guzmanii]KAJ3741930.1 Ctr copper transporter [Lentinula detonsa]KAJ3787859.1 Ctr copper transporter [Lentinula aff. detonsa]KAJ3802446.1 Ctr copper transporter [Lentinula aff. detonsa]
MDHGDHGGHDMPMPMCSMNMLWNTQIIDTCIVFRTWHISTNTAFSFSCLAIIGLGVLYEYLRVLQKSIDTRIALSLVKDQRRNRSRSSSGRSTPEVPLEDEGLLSGRVFKANVTGVPVPLPSRIIRSVLYGISVFLSFFLMLVFMTYNAYLILSVVLGAAIGHFIFGGSINPESILASDGKGMACH